MGAPKVMDICKLDFRSSGLFIVLVQYLLVDLSFDFCKCLK